MKSFFKLLLKIIGIAVALFVLFIIIILVIPVHESGDGRVVHEDFQEINKDWTSNTQCVIQDGLLTISTKVRFEHSFNTKLKDGKINLRLKLPQKGMAGITFRKIDNEHFETLLLRKDGQVIVAQYTPRGYQNIISDKITIDHPNDFNVLTISFEGDLIHLSLDGKEKASFTYPAIYTEGDVGLLVQKNTELIIDELDIFNREKMTASVHGIVKLDNRPVSDIKVSAYRVLDIATLSVVFVGSVKTDDSGNYDLALPTNYSYMINAGVTEEAWKQGQGAFGGRFVDFEYETAPVSLNIIMSTKL